MTNIRYRPNPESPRIEIESPRDPFEVMDYVRNKWHPEVKPDLREPAYRRAVEIAKKGSKDAS